MKQVNIIAMSPNTPPPAKIEGDIWSINNSHAVWKRAGRGYKPHLIIALDDLRRDEKTHPDYVEEIVTAGCPVYNTHNSDKWPSVEEFPLKQVWKAFPKIQLYDNSINYAFMLALTRGYKEICFFGTDFVEPYNKKLLRGADARWVKRGHEDTPRWFRYYDEMNINWRAPCEPGQESFHFLMGVAHASDVKSTFGKNTTALNFDREPFFYGYQVQPEGLDEPV